MAESTTPSPPPPPPPPPPPGMRAADHPANGRASIDLDPSALYSLYPMQTPIHAHSRLLSSITLIRDLIHRLGTAHVRSMSSLPTALSLLSLKIRHTMQGELYITLHYIYSHAHPSIHSTPLSSLFCLRTTRIPRWTGGWLDGWLAGRTAGWTDGWLDGWLAGRMAGWLDGHAINPSIFPPLFAFIRMLMSAPKRTTTTTTTTIDVT